MISSRWMYYLYSFIKNCIFFSAALTPFFMDFGHLNEQQMLMVQLWFLVGVFVLEVPTGAIADIFGRKWSLAAGAATATVAVLFMPMRPEVWWFLIGETIFAISETLISGADEAWIVDSLLEDNVREDEVRAVLNRGQTFNQVGMLVGALIGSGIMVYGDVRWPMWLTSITAILAVVTALYMKEPSRRTAIQKVTWKGYLGTIKTGFGYFLGHVQLRKLALDGIFVASAAYFVMWFYQPLLGMVGVPKEQFGVYHAFLLAVEIPVAALYNPLSRLLGQRRIIRLTAALASGGILVGAVAWFTGIPNLMYYGALTFLVFGGGVGLTRFSLVRSYMHKHIEGDKRATVLSAMSMFRRFSPGLLIPVMGWVFVHAPNHGWAMLLLGVLAGVPVFMKYRE